MEKKISGIEGYSIDDTGKVYSFRRGGRRIELKFLYTKGKEEKGSYRKVNLTIQTGTIKSFLVHRLVAEAFIENAKGYPIVNHKDGNKFNNSSYNLEWCTYQQNSNHAKNLGLLGGHKWSELSKQRLRDKKTSNRAKLSFDQVEKIRYRYNVLNESFTEICKHFPTNRIATSRVARSEAYSHIKTQYDIKH